MTDSVRMLQIPEVTKLIVQHGGSVLVERIVLTPPPDFVVTPAARNGLLSRAWDSYAAAGVPLVTYRWIRHCSEVGRSLCRALLLCLPFAHCSLLRLLYRQPTLSFAPCLRRRSTVRRMLLSVCPDIKTRSGPLYWIWRGCSVSTAQTGWARTAAMYALCFVVVS